MLVIFFPLDTSQIEGFGVFEFWMANLEHIARLRCLGVSLCW